MKTVFHVSIYSLIALSGLILTIAEESFFPTVLTVPVALLALLLNEHLKVVRLSVFWSNLLGIAAFGIAALELTGANVETRVLAGAHLLTYLTWIALFQTKRGRQYWWLLALSVMQVAVSSILTEQGLFGVLLTVYVFFGLWTLAVFSVYQAQSGFDQAGHIGGGSKKELIETTGLAHRQKDEFRSAIQLDPDERWFNFRFVTGVVTTSLLSLFIGLCFFLVIPRLWVARQPNELDSDPRSRLVTGFTNEIQLGEIGQILESNKPVLQVRCFDREASKEVATEDLAARLGYSEPLFRGSVMGHYEKGRWHVLDDSRNVIELLSARGHHGSRYLQQIILHDASTNTLFAMHPIRMAEIEPGEKLPEVDLVTSILMRPESERGRGSYEYALHTYVPNRRQRPALFEVKSSEAYRARNLALDRFLRLPDGLSAIRQAGQQIAEAAPADLNEYQRAEWIAQQVEAHLRDSGEFSYSLSAAITDTSIDPVEDFYVNRKSGHCEYFASAMALMLRAAGVPSRLVSGFKGGERSSYSGAFVVEERHAHAWVEAMAGNIWKPFDPTPGDARAASVKEIGDDRSIAAEMRTLVTGLWHQRIVRISLNEQRRLIYGPLSEGLKHATGSTVTPETWKEILKFARDPTRWFSGTTFVATFIFAGVVLLLRRFWQKLALSEIGLVERFVLAIRDWLERRRERRELCRVDFYERFTKVLARHGIRRGRSETPLEFAEAAQQRLEEILADTGLTGFPDNLVRKFYDVRYGDASLEPRDSQAISDLLTRLEGALTTKKNGSARRPAKVQS
ncbi:MAG: transglutaminaseTgpA domain-containing protein [Planctomycetota bacterium]|nr:transglutaminaseTgpA domain-containing protein [Planctomycetota bacterium]MDA1247647.1 transglutaminaseTgpA domain-containing protein [Planctomycetota bacterium]